MKSCLQRYVRLHLDVVLVANTSVNSRQDSADLGIAQRSVTPCAFETTPCPTLSSVQLIHGAPRQEELLQNTSRPSAGVTASTVPQKRRLPSPVAEENGDTPKRQRLNEVISGLADSVKASRKHSKPERITDGSKAHFRTSPNDEELATALTWLEENASDLSSLQKPFASVKTLSAEQIADADGRASTQSAHYGQDIQDDLIMLFECLASEVLVLRAKNEDLHEHLDAITAEMYPPEAPPRMEMAHRVSCDCSHSEQISYFADRPRFNWLSGSDHVQGRSSVTNPADSVLSKQNNIVLVVYKDYVCSKSARRQRVLMSRKGPRTTTDEDMFAPSGGEAGLIVSDSTCKAFESVLGRSDAAGIHPQFGTTNELKAPYAFFYHNRYSIREEAERAATAQLPLIKVIMAYFDSFETEFSEADNLFSQGEVTQQLLQYLFEPAQVIVRDKFGESLACYTTSYLFGEDSVHATYWLNAWCWKYDGEFWKDSRDIKLQFPDSSERVLITDLAFYPLKYAAKGVEDCIRKRGMEFWKSRHKRYVQYSDADMLEVRLVSITMYPDNRIPAVV